MKKIIIALLAFVLIIGLATYEKSVDSNDQEADTEVQEEVEDTVEDETDEEVEAEDSTDTQVLFSTLVHTCDENCDHEEVSTLISSSGLTIDADETFVLEYQENAIDIDYLIALNEAESITTMVEIANEASAKWENAITNILLLLKEEMDEVEWSDLNISQTAWENDIDIVADELLSETESAGSTGRVDYAQGMMYYYRDRAIELAVMYYDMMNIVELPNPELEAVG